MGVQNVKNTMVDRVLGIMAPHLCSGCGKVGRLICDDCKYNITRHPFTDCIVCQRPTSVGICIEHNKSYQKAWVVGERNGGLQRLIGGFKFQNMKAAASDLAGLLDQRLPALPVGTIIVSIPTAPAHIRERGYDHMQLIARYFALYRGLPLGPLLVRDNTATQHHADRQRRIQQAASAFRVNGVVNPLATYLILDDVVTTGSTIDQASRLLAEAGAQTVWVAAIARQPLD